MIWTILLIYSSLTFAQFNPYDIITAYEQECYEDSSLQRIHTMPPVNSNDYCIVDSKCIVASHWSNEWVHREPTWEGFREFIKNKYRKIVQVK